MGTTKTNLFSDTENRIAELAKAIGHPARVAILNRLAKESGCFCGDLVDELPLSQSTISQHLKALKAAGIITGNSDGKSTCYCINAKTWKETSKLLSALFSDINKCC